MNFSQVDPVIRAWGVQNNIPLSTVYQDAEVRSFQLAGAVARAQIWVEVDERVTVHVWDYRKRRREFVTGVANLAESLDRALAVARLWCDTR